MENSNEINDNMNPILAQGVDSIVVKEGEISFKDFDAVKSFITELASRYENVHVTSETLKEDKKIKSNLNSVKKILSDKRIAIKKDILLPYLNFETQVKDLDTILSEVSNSINEQIKGLELQEKEEKKETIKTWFNDFTEGESKTIKTIIVFDKIFKEEYLNKSMSYPKIYNEMSEILLKLCEEVKLIMCEPYPERVLRQYVDNNYNYAQAKTFVIDVLRKEEEILERQSEENKRKQEEEIARIEREKAINEAVDKETVETVEVVDKPVDKVINVPILTGNFKAIGTKENLQLLKRYAEKIGVKLIAIK